jgi:hypothetical protein
MDHPLPFSFFRLRSRQLACFSALVRAMSELSDYAAMVISHNRLIDDKQRSPSCTALCAATLSNRHEVLRCTKQVEITLADPVFGPQRQISRKFFRCPERLISAIGME